MPPMRLPGPCSRPSGTVDVPGSKSLTNRALVAAAMAGGGRVDGPLDCEDTRFLAGALSDAGWRVAWEEGIRVGPRTPPAGIPVLQLGNSGTGARLLLGLLAASPGSATVDGSPRLRQRPMGPLLEALERLGARLERAGPRLPVTVHGRELDGGAVRIRPEVSSQFVSSLLLAAPLMRNGLDLEVVGELPSGPYVDLTADVMAAFGVRVEGSPDRTLLRVPAGTARPATLSVEGDWSAAAFFAAAAAVAGGSVTVRPLSPASRQGDRRICDVLRSAGMTVAARGDGVTFEGPARARFVADLTDAPDMFPALAVVAAALPGSELTGLDHLRHKESDRLAVMVDNLDRLGCGPEVCGPTFRVRHRLGVQGGTDLAVTAADDHRVAMAMAVAALVAGPLLLDEPDCVAKSFPDFWGRWNALIGGTCGSGGPVP